MTNQMNTLDAHLAAAPDFSCYAASGALSRPLVTWMQGGRGLGRSGPIWSLTATSKEGRAKGRGAITLKKQGLHATSFATIAEARQAAEEIEAARHAQVHSLAKLTAVELLFAHRGQRHLIAMLDDKVLLDQTELAVVQNRQLEQNEKLQAIEKQLAALNVHPALRVLN